ncbi:MAG TPA: hypothetical protein VGR84_05440 [Candidatus Acidoferrales bacterium]|nr:hypothetical protein [Candidatus Acidoferrales bacterium]
MKKTRAALLAAAAALAAGFLLTGAQCGGVPPKCPLTTHAEQHHGEWGCYPNS